MKRRKMYDRTLRKMFKGQAKEEDPTKDFLGGKITEYVVKEIEASGVRITNRGETPNEKIKRSIICHTSKSKKDEY